jgi:hypothetical protein
MIAAMKFQLIEPAPRRIHNAELRRELASKAHQCAKWLRISGYKVIAVSGGLRQPRIVIEAEPLCDRLEGAVDGYERTAHGERRYRYVLRFDVMVEWEVA